MGANDTQFLRAIGEFRGCFAFLIDGTDPAAWRRVLAENE
jgi:hypothetical protein